MSVPSIILVYGVALSLVLSVLLIAVIRISPRLMLPDYPKDVQAAVPPQTVTEQRQARIMTVILIVLLVGFSLAAALTARAAGSGFVGTFLSAAGVPFVFNVVDLLILDWLIFCTFKPAFSVLPGTEGMAGYNNYAMHVRGFVMGTLLSVVVGGVVAIIVTFG
jgi:hypothetical protein